ncbi:MAG: hypothetical protein ABI433_00125 [Burkholderiaceae bacterium]
MQTDFRIQFDIVNVEKFHVNHRDIGVHPSDRRPTMAANPTET